MLLLTPPQPHTRSVGSKACSITTWLGRTFLKDKIPHRNKLSKYIRNKWMVAIMTGSFSRLTLLDRGYGSFSGQKMTSPGFAFPGPSKLPTIKGAQYVMTEMLCYTCTEEHSSFQANRTEPSSVSDSLSCHPSLKPQPWHGHLPSMPAPFSFPSSFFPHLHLPTRLGTGYHLGVAITDSKLEVVLLRAMSHRDSFACFLAFPMFQRNDIAAAWAQ